jgi:hypothetical protein
MATTLPQLTETIDNAFIHTWYEIRETAIDNILDATVVWAALMGAGSFTPQVGGRFITRTIRYGEQDSTDVAKGDTLPQGEPELETMARWTWRYIATHVQRSTFDDQQNNGPSKIKDLVGTKLDAARDGMEQRYETVVMNATASDEVQKTMQGLNDAVPALADATSGTYGGINRPTAYADSGNGVQTASTGNTWWGSKYLAGTLTSLEDDLLTDMKKLYNSLHNNQSPPNLMLVTQTIFEAYEEFALDISQIIKDETTRLADLGFEVLRFKGKPLTWSPNVVANTVMMLNLDFIELVYDPNLWFDMTDFKPIPLQAERIAHILSAANLVGTQPRRQGRILYA